ncbi:DNA-3-methyladenine glycosylase 2 family protein [Nitriliruptoraceae bacterium ZYF776]|nr:DNA-3-methyladenine glycosylase 2 family protein [Profundirhabdus halotolerans]
MRTFTVPLEIDLLRSLRPLVASAQDPTVRLRPDEMLRAAWTPDGPGTLHVQRDGSPRRFTAHAHGPGAAFLLEQAPALLGADDDLDGFEPRAHPRVHDAAKRRRDLRLVRSGLVWDLLVPTILAQRVTGGEAARSWTRLVRQHGEPAPGPYPGLTLPPSPATVAALPSWVWHRLGVEVSRARACAEAARRHRYLQDTLSMAPTERVQAFQRVRGIGPWTAALVLRVAAGDPDRVEVGDFHVKHQISWQLAGEPRGTDERMLELLRPFAGHRGRVVRLLLSVSQGYPSFGPRLRVVPVHQM